MKKTTSSSKEENTKLKAAQDKLEMAFQNKRRKNTIWLSSRLRGRHLESPDGQPNINGIPTATRNGKAVM